MQQFSWLQNYFFNNNYDHYVTTWYFSKTAPLDKYVQCVNFTLWLFGQNLTCRQQDILVQFNDMQYCKTTL